MPEPIHFDADFDMGSADVARCVAEDGVIRLVGRDRHFPEHKPGWWKWLYVRVDGLAGMRPRFELSHRFEPGPDRLPRYTMLFSEDQSEWTAFSHHAVEGEVYLFEHDTQFAADSVWVAAGLPYPLSRVRSHTARLRGAELVRPTDSSNAELVLGRSPGGTDDLGRRIPPQDLYAYRIGHGARRVVLMSGLHPNEGPGSLVLEGLVDWLVGDEAGPAREAATFDVYPMVNPDGRLAGLNRTTVQHLDRDANRLWREDLYQDADDARRVAEAVLRDLGGARPDYFIDCHAWSDNRPPFGILSSADGFDRDPFWLKLRELEPELEFMDSGWGNPSTETWAFQTLKARFCMTLEATYRADWGEARLRGLGAGTGRALQAALMQ